MTPSLTRGNGASLRLGRELARGGEGTVFDVADHPTLVAKLYHAMPDRDKADKLAAMVHGGTDRLRAIAAWPIDTLRRGGSVCGFLMRRVAGQHDIHILYGPKTRLRVYSDATYRFLVHVAANLARAFAVVHEHGHVIGDVNQGGVCVTEQGTVTLVDCDSFQVRASQRVFHCDVGIPTYQPPELQHVTSFRSLARTTNHDLFGLAVLIFQTLFLARHPFSGAFQGDGDMPIERAIRERRFAYGHDAAQRQMEQPPGSLGLSSISFGLAALFERAFLEDGVRGARPSARDWVMALDAFGADVRVCARNSGHAYLHALTQCPLCELELRTGSMLFLPAKPTTSSPTVDIEAVWRELVPLLHGARVPGNLVMDVPVRQPSQHVKRFCRVRSWSRSLGYALAMASLAWASIYPIGLVGIFVAWWLPRVLRPALPAEANDLAARVGAARKRLATVQEQLEHERLGSPLPALETRGRSLYHSLGDVSLQRSERLRQLAHGRYSRQLSRFLDRYELSAARIKGLGPSRLAVLISHGVETADDVTRERLEHVPGFGQKRISALLEWRRQVEATFVFDVSDHADASERAQIERELQIEHAKQVGELLRIADQIKAYAAPARQRIAALVRELDVARDELGNMLAVETAIGYTL